MDFFINSAYAQTADAAAQSPGIISYIMPIGLVIIFYFIIWRPQSKRAKEQKSLVESIGKGDEVMTTGGMLGKVTKVDDNYVALTVAENVEINMQKSSVIAILPKGTIKAI